MMLTVMPIQLPPQLETGKKCQRQLHKHSKRDCLRGVQVNTLLQIKILYNRDSTTRIMREASKLIHRSLASLASMVGLWPHQEGAQLTLSPTSQPLQGTQAQQPQTQALKSQANMKRAQSTTMKNKIKK